MNVRPCLRCRRACTRGLWCEVCVVKGQEAMRREARKPVLQREVFRGLDYPAHLRAVIVELEAMEVAV